MPVPATPSPRSVFGVTNLDPAGAPRAVAVGLNAGGEVVGDYDDGVGGAFVFTFLGGTFQKVTTPPGVTYMRAVGINDAGMIAGNYIDSNGRFLAFIRDGDTFTPIDHPGATGVYAEGINAKGDIVGHYYDIAGEHGFIDSNGEFITIDVPGAALINAASINDQDQVVGNYSASPFETHGYLYDNGTITTIDVPGQADTTLNQINDSGVIAGSYAGSMPFPQFAGSRQQYAFLFESGTITTLTIPGAMVAGSDVRINNTGEVVGSYRDSQFAEHGFVYNNGTLGTFDFPLIAGGSLAWFNLYGLADDGSIVGMYGKDNPDAHAFIGQTAPSIPLLQISVLDTLTGGSVISTARIYTGPVIDLQNQYVTITPESLSITTASDNWFIHAGTGNDVVAVHGGTNVLDGGGGSDLLVGGSGQDVFFADTSRASSDFWDTLINVHTGDACTLWGLTPTDFKLDWMDGQGATGFTGLTLHATSSQHATASLTLVGYTTTDLNTGRLALAFGTDAASGSAFLSLTAE